MHIILSFLMERDLSCCLRSTSHSGLISMYVMNASLIWHISLEWKMHLNRKISSQRFLNYRRHVELMTLRCLITE